MSKSYEIHTVEQLIDVVTPDNVDTLKHDIGEFLDYIVMLKTQFKGVATTKPYFKWNDDGEKGLKAVHLYIPEENK